MKIAILYVGLFFWIPFYATGQQDMLKPLNTLSVELGKTGIIWGAYWDKKFASGKSGFRVGGGHNFGRYYSAGMIGGGVYRLLGGDRDFFETGVDVVLFTGTLISDDQVSGLGDIVYPRVTIAAIYPSVNLGYRRYGKKNIFRMGIAPSYLNKEFFTGGYISFGWYIGKKKLLNIE